MFSLTLGTEAATATLRILRQKVDAVRGDVLDALKGPIRDNVLTRVRSRLAPYPPERAPGRFEFSTPRSRNFWFHLVDHGLVPTDGYSYSRTEDLLNGWDVTVNLRANEGILRVTNNAIDGVGGGRPYAQWVYGFDVTGYRQVYGHLLTGWGADLRREVLGLQAYVKDEIEQAFRNEFKEFQS